MKFISKILILILISSCVTPNTETLFVGSDEVVEITSTTTTTLAPTTTTTLAPTTTTTLAPTTTTTLAPTTTTTVAAKEIKNEITDPPIISFEISQDIVSINNYPVITYKLASYIETKVSNCDFSLVSINENSSGICNELAGIGFMYSAIGATADSDKRIFSLIDTNFDGKTDYICAPQVIDYYNDPFCRDYFGTGSGGWTMRNKGNDGWGYEYELVGVYSIYNTNDDEYLKVTGLPISKDYFKNIPGFDNTIYKIEVGYCAQIYVPSFAYGISQQTINIATRPGGMSFSPVYCGSDTFGTSWKSGEYFFYFSSTKSNEVGENKSLSSFVGSGNGILPFDNYSKRLFSK